MLQMKLYNYYRTQSSTNNEIAILNISDNELEYYYENLG